MLHGGLRLSRARGRFELVRESLEQRTEVLAHGAAARACRRYFPGAGLPRRSHRDPGGCGSDSARTMRSRAATGCRATRVRPARVPHWRWEPTLVNLRSRAAPASTRRRRDGRRAAGDRRRPRRRGRTAHSSIPTPRRPARDLLDDGRVEVVAAWIALGGGASVLRFRTRVLVNAAGPWVDVGAHANARALARTPGRPDPDPLLRPSRGIHLVYPTLTRGHGLLLNSHAATARVCFVIPFAGMFAGRHHRGRSRLAAVAPPIGVSSLEEIRYLRAELASCAAGSPHHLPPHGAALGPVCCSPPPPSSWSVARRASTRWSTSVAC